MRILTTLALLLASFIPVLGATTWPASTNAPNQTFFGTNRFNKPIFGTDGTFTGPVMNTNNTTHNWALYNASSEVRSNTSGSYFVGTNGSGTWFNGANSNSVVITNGSGTFSGTVTAGRVTGTVPTVNALDYGADSTGTADSTTNIQAALDSLTSGGDVYIPRGTFKVLGTLYLGGNTSFRGAGSAWSPGTTLFHLTNDSPLICISNVTGATVSSLYLLGAAPWLGPSYPTTGIGISIVGNAQSVMLDSVLINNFSNGIILKDTWIDQINNCSAINCANGISGQGDANAIRVVGGQYQHNTNGIAFDLSSSAVLSIETTIEGNYWNGIVVTNAHDTISIANCYFESNGTNDIYISGPGPSATTCKPIISKNFFSQTPTNIVLVATPSVVIENNACYAGSTTLAFIVADSGSTKISVRNNSESTLTSYIADTNTQSVLKDGSLTLGGTVAASRLTGASATLESNGFGSNITHIFWLTNATAAASGVQQSSPAFALGGQGFRTGNSTTMPVSMGMHVVPIQTASVNPSARLYIDAGISNAPSSTGTYFTSAGALTLAGSLTSGLDIGLATSGTLYFGASSGMQSPTDGEFLLFNSGQTTFNKISFGSKTANWPMLKVVSTNNVGFLVRNGSDNAFVNVTAAAYFIPTNTIVSQTINMASYGESSFYTNAAFSIIGYSNLSTTNYQNRTLHFAAAGSALAITFPANTHVVGTAYVTNQTDVLLHYDPSIPTTNAICTPIY